MERYKDTYWSRYAEEGWYFAGDGAKYDEDGALGCSAASTTS